MLCVSMLVCLYYNVIIAWTFYYLGSSFQSPLPWSCDAPANAYLCGNATTGNSSSGTGLSPSEVFWNERVLDVVNSNGLHDPGPVRWPQALCLLTAWIIIFFCMLKGIRSSGKVLHWRGHFRVWPSTSPLTGRLASAQVWNDAASQIFYSLGIGVGGLLSMASYNKFDNNVIRDCLVITIGNCSTSFFAVFAIFSNLGHMAWWKGVPVGVVADTGVNQFRQDIIDMICLCPPWCRKVLLYFKACWVFCTPFLLLFILIYIFIEMYNTPLHYGPYVYPRWGKALGCAWAPPAVCRSPYGPSWPSAKSLGH
ncbi:hypothetical protein J4Q44_G00070960 [Coregonus suidteri]|uniref:Uncharacterized protein n=1 Tax=Coregonus suidteri TaxID=861788 RepID=A0AAN8M4D1_9TELE